MGLSPTSGTAVLAAGKGCSPLCPMKVQPSRSKSHFSPGEAMCLLARETGDIMRSRNKKATGGGWVGRKNHRSQFRRDYVSSTSTSGVTPDMGIAFVQLSYLLLSYTPLTLLLHPITYIWLKCFFQKSLI